MQQQEEFGMCNISTNAAQQACWVIVAHSAVMLGKVAVRIPAMPVPPHAKLETNLQPKLTAHNSSLANL